jgi:hypothetical protein
MQLINKNFMDKMNAENVPLLAALDSAGFLICGTEDAEAFKSRLNKLLERYEEFEKELAEKGSIKVFEEYELKAGDRIPPEIMAEASAFTERLFGFSVDWAPGFFLSQNLSFLWGGCAITDPDEYFTVFLIRSSFAAKPRWFIYRREELLAHELCHAARMVLNDACYEEHFAYMTASSRLRKYIGNCFQTKYDAILFILPVFILLAAVSFQTFFMPDFPSSPFWALAFAYPLFLLIRNHFQRKTYFAAHNLLSACGCAQPRAVLFRCSTTEIKQIATYRKTPHEWSSRLNSMAEKSLKWRVIKYRFFDNGEPAAIFNDNVYTEDENHGSAQ